MLVLEFHGCWESTLAAELCLKAGLSIIDRCVIHYEDPTSRPRAIWLLRSILCVEQSTQVRGLVNLPSSQVHGELGVWGRSFYLASAHFSGAFRRSKDPFRSVPIGGHSKQYSLTFVIHHMSSLFSQSLNKHVTGIHPGEARGPRKEGLLYSERCA